MDTRLSEEDAEVRKMKELHKELCERIEHEQDALELGRTHGAEDMFAIGYLSALRDLQEWLEDE